MKDFTFKATHLLLAVLTLIILALAAGTGFGIKIGVSKETNNAICAKIDVLSAQISNMKTGYDTRIKELEDKYDEHDLQIVRINNIATTSLDNSRETQKYVKTFSDNYVSKFDDFKDDLNETMTNFAKELSATTASVNLFLNRYENLNKGG